MIFPKKPVSQSRNNNYAIILLKHMKMKMHAYIKKKKEKEGDAYSGWRGENGAKDAGGGR